MADDEIEYNLVLEDGTVLKSSWDYTGKATATYSNGDIYEGYFADGKRHGHGKYSYVTGEIYEGLFNDNLKHGIGKITYGENKGSYHGYFVKGKRQGEGTFIYANGDIYSGSWRDSLKHGNGTYIVKETGVKYKGNWGEGKLLKGQWVFPSTMRYEGTFEHNKPKSKGTWHFPNGNSSYGAYKQTVRPSDEDEEKLTISVSWTTQA